MTKLKIGIIRERKNPPDSRVPLSPDLCQQLLEKYGDKISLAVEKSPNRSFKDEEFAAIGIEPVDSVADCSILLGVKEVPIDHLIADKTYFFFSHTIKKQAYNKGLMQTLLKRKIRMVDYECLANPPGKRILGFGRFAGIVGAHNGLMSYGLKTGLFSLPEAHSSTDLAEIRTHYDKVKLPAMKIAITGGGRVAKGAVEVMHFLKIKEVSPEEYLSKSHFDEVVFTQLYSQHLNKRKDGSKFERKTFYGNPELFESAFEVYSQETDLLIHGIYWDPAAPILFTKAEMRSPKFRIKVIADVTCDIDGSIPATTKATKIGDPTFGYDPQSEKEVKPYSPNSIDIMSVDNLPNELPRDASHSFGTVLLEKIIPELLKEESDILNRASITNGGELGPNFDYLHDFAYGNVVS